MFAGSLLAALAFTSFGTALPAQADTTTKSAASQADGPRNDRKVQRKIDRMSAKVAARAGVGSVCTPSTKTADGVQYNFTTCVEASSNVTSSAVAKGKAKTTASGALLLYFISPDGLPKAEQDGCQAHKVGERFLTDYYNSLGQRVWKWKTVQPGDKFCFDHSGVLRDTECGNEAKFNPPKKLRKKAFKGRVKIRRQGRMHGEAKAETSGKSHSGVVAVQLTGFCAGSTASGNGTSEYYARAKSAFWARSMSKLEAMFEAEELKLKTEEENKARGSASALAMGKAHTDAYGKIVCNTPPTVDVCPDIPGDQPEGTDCTPPNEDNPPEMTCTGMEHIFVGESRSAYDFDASDIDGHVITFGAPVVTGPVNVVTVERSGNRLTVWITAQDIPAGTSQAASVKVTATANGKPVPCTVNLTVENNHTGWKAAA
jgi:hypothetical protein